MRRLLRPSLLVVVSAVLLLAAIVILWPVWGQTRLRPATPLPVPPGDQEVVFLGAATNNAASWERFVAAIRRLPMDRPELHLQVVAADNAFPAQTTAIPELALSVAGKPGRLWFRWYKLTGDIDTHDWVQALTQRQPPPLAIIGGGSSDRARDLALELKGQGSGLADPPLLLITTATAELVSLDDNPPSDLMDLYPGRTFRYCFTDRQMAEAVTDFVWRSPDLRPDEGPIYLVHWQDDPYSEDLWARFHEPLWGDDGSGGVLGRPQAMERAARSWGWLAGPPSWNMLSAATGGLNDAAFSIAIPFSIGDYNQPNAFDADAARRIMASMDRHREQNRPLLVLPAAPQPARRLLHALLRIDPVAAGRFIVVTGDGVDFNTIYHDRNLAWPIQDLPFQLVLFCHRNPVDPIAFQPDEPTREPAVPDPAGRTSTGTQDLLLYRDIVESVARAAYQGRGLTASPAELRQALRNLPHGGPLFDQKGNLDSSSGEYVVVLHPIRQPDGEQLSPTAGLQVWNRHAGPGGRAWIPVPIAGQPELTVRYGAVRQDDVEAPPP